MGFGRVEDDLDKREMDFGNLGVDFRIVELGRFDKWRSHSDKLKDIWDD